MLYEISNGDKTDPLNTEGARAANLDCLENNFLGVLSS